MNTTLQSLCKISLLFFLCITWAANTAKAYGPIAAPMDITLSSSSINEKVAAGSLVGVLNTIDANASSTHTYSLTTGVGDTDNNAFSISGNILKINISPNYQVKNTYSIRIRSIDGSAANYEKVFIITINQLSAAVTYVATSPNEDTALNGVSDVAVSPDGKFVYVAATGSAAITTFERNQETGTLTYRGKTIGSDAVSAAFSVDVSSDNKSLYAASPTGHEIVAFSRNETTGALTLVNRATNTGGTRGFVSVTVSPDAKFVYGVGGSPSGLVVFKRDTATGAISFLADYKDNQNGHALGQLFNASSSPIKNVATSADSRFVYVTSTQDHAVTLFSRHATTGLLTQIAVYTDGVDGVDGLRAASSTKISPDGKNLYVTGQGEHSVAIFSINSTSGELTYLTKVTNGADGVVNMQGARSLAVSPDGRYVLVSVITSDAVIAFLRDAATGLLTFDGAAQYLVNGVTGLDGPSGMATDPLNRHLYVAGQNSSSIVVFSLPTPAVRLSVTNKTAVALGTPIVLDDQLVISNSGSPNLVSATVSITAGFVSTDLLTVQTLPGIAASYDAQSGTLLLSGNASLEDYQTALRSVTYKAGVNAASSNGGISERTISFLISDSRTTSARANMVVKVEPPPVNSPAKVTSVAVPTSDTYKIGDNLDFTVNYDKDVLVTGIPRLVLTVGSSIRYAVYKSDVSTVGALAFRYTVLPGDLDEDGVTLGAMELNGASIKDVEDLDAVLILNNQGSTAAVLIDGIVPAVEISSDVSLLKIGKTATFTFKFNKPVSGFVNENLTIANGTLSPVSSLDGRVTWTAMFTPSENTESASNVINLDNTTVTDGAGNKGVGSTSSNNYSIDTKAPAAPTGLDFVSGDTQNELSWSPNTESDIAYYNVYAGTVSDSKGLLATVIAPTTGYTHTGIMNGTVYYYHIVAVDQVGNESPVSDEISATPKAPQVITFLTLATKIYGDADFYAGATSTNNSITITYKSSDETVATIVDGKIHVVGAGVTYITAYQTGSAAYTPAIEVTQTLTIDKAPLTGISLLDKNFGYDGTAKSLAIGGVLPQGVSVSYTGNGQTEAGVHTVMAVISGANYIPLTLTAKLTIDKAALTGISLLDKNFGYDGTAKSLAIGGVLPQGVSVSYTGNGQTEAGVYTVMAVISGANYIPLTLTAKLNIDKAALTGISLLDKNFGYDGTAKSLAIGGVLPQGVSVSYTGYGQTEAGVHTVTAVISGANYIPLTLTAKLTIDKAALTGISLLDKNFGYDGTAKSLAIGGVLPQGVSVSYTGNGQTEAGVYTVMAVISGANYVPLTLTAKLTIDKAALSGISLLDKSFGYDGTAKSLAIGGVLPQGVSASYTGNGQTEAGVYTVMAVISGANYVPLTLTAKLTIDKAKQTISFTVPTTLSRDAGKVALEVSSTSGLIVSVTSDDHMVATVSGTDLNVLSLGTVRVTATQAGNENYEAASPVTVSVRVANDASANLPIIVNKALSPNGDGINEFLIIEGIRDYADNKVTIFDRNGIVLAEIQGYDNRERVFFGNAHRDGTYYYYIDVKDGNNWKREKGFFVIKR